MKNKNSLVSIIIPVYNVEKYLDRCIKSVISQSYDNLEIIIVDDGSTDNSSKICDNFTAIDDRIRVFHKKNGGLGSARNYGFEHSSGNYILFLDSDDYIENDAVEKMINLGDYDIVCCGFDRVDEETKKVYSREMINLPFSRLSIDDKTIAETAFLSPSGWGKLYKRNVIEKIRFSNDKRSIEDILFYLELIPNVNNIGFIKEVLWHYMVRKNSLIMSLSIEKADLFEQELLKIKEKYETNNYSTSIFDYLTLQIIIHNCISIPSRLYNNNDCNVNKRIKHIKEFMDDNFPNWKNIKINVKGRKIKKLAIYIIIFMYKIGIFKLFLSTYNFCINKLKIDVKW